jgi:hypothetical protein
MPAQNYIEQNRGQRIVRALNRGVKTGATLLALGTTAACAAKSASPDQSHPASAQMPSFFATIKAPIPDFQATDLAHYSRPTPYPTKTALPSDVQATPDPNIFATYEAGLKTLWEAKPREFRVSNFIKNRGFGFSPSKGQNSEPVQIHNSSQVPYLVIDNDSLEHFLSTLTLTHPNVVPCTHTKVTFSQTKANFIHPDGIQDGLEAFTIGSSSSDPLTRTNQFTANFLAACLLSADKQAHPNLVIDETVIKKAQAKGFLPVAYANGWSSLQEYSAQAIKNGFDFDSDTFGNGEDLDKLSSEYYALIKAYPLRGFPLPFRFEQEEPKDGKLQSSNTNSLENALAHLAARSQPSPFINEIRNNKSTHQPKEQQVSFRPVQTNSHVTIYKRT